MMTAEISATITRLAQIMATLRSSAGCPWDAAQTPETLKPYIIEETYEVLEAIEQGDSDAIRDELGDLLLQVVFQAQIFSERGDFDLSDVANSISDKLVRRHPHVFGDEKTTDIKELNAQWNRIKGEEKRNRGEKTTALGGIPRALPALMRANKMAEKFHRAKGNAPPLPHLLESFSKQMECFTSTLPHNATETSRTRFGRLLLTLVEIGHTLGIDTEESLHQTVTNIISSIERNPNLHIGEGSLSDIASNL